MNRLENDGAWKAYDRVYLGNEFCELALPSAREYRYWRVGRRSPW